MSKGMLNNPAGPRNNFGYQISALQLLGAISASVAPPGGLATEATALNILSAIQNGQEFEQNIVVDLGGVGCPNNCPTYLMVRIWNTVTHTFDPPIYYDASGAVVVPVGPVELVNPQFVLNNILAQITSLNTNYTAVSRVPSVVNVGTNVAGSTTAGVQSVSLRFIGTNGTLNGVNMPNGSVVSFSAKAGDTIGAISYNSPTSAGGRLIITYLT